MKFTVVLHRPAYVSEWFEADPKTDVYVALVDELNTQKAILAARREVRYHDKKDWADLQMGGVFAVELMEYTMLCAFKGHPKGLVHGCATGWNR